MRNASRGCGCGGARARTVCEGAGVEAAEFGNGGVPCGHEFSEEVRREREGCQWSACHGLVGGKLVARTAREDHRTALAHSRPVSPLLLRDSCEPSEVCLTSFPFVLIEEYFFWGPSNTTRPGKYVDQLFGRAKDTKTEEQRSSSQVCTIPFGQPKHVIIHM